MQLGPVVGIYAPTKDVDIGSHTAQQRHALMYGVEAQTWLDSGISLQLFLARGSGDLYQGADPSGTPASSTPATVTQVALSVRFALPGVAETTPLWIALGPSFITRGGDGYRQFHDRATLGGLLGLGTRIRLSPRLYLEAGAETLLSSLAMRDNTQAYPATFQVDFQARLGLLLHLGSPF